MKKIFILAIALFITGVANAQSPVRLGAKAGLNLSNIIKDDGNNSFDTEMKAGFHAGLTLDITLIEGISFSPEAVYSQKGYKSTSSFGEFTQTTNFLDIPFLATINLAGSGFNIVAGPQVSFLLSTKNKFETGFGTVEQETIEDESDRFKKSLVGGVVGFRYDVNDRFNIHGRYALDFQKNNENGSNTTPEFKNQVFAVGLGVRF